MDNQCLLSMQLNAIGGMKVDTQHKMCTSLQKQCTVRKHCTDNILMFSYTHIC